MLLEVTELFLTLSLITGTSTDKLDEKLTEFCSRDRNIVAASKSHLYGQFYLYEEEHAWVFDFDEQKIVQFISDEYVKGRLNGEKILRASGGYKCDQSDQLQFTGGRFASTISIHVFEVMEDNSTWRVEDAKERHDNITVRYGMRVDGFKVEDLVTVGSTYFYESQGNCPIRSQMYFLPDKIRLCSRKSKECVDEEHNIGVYHPFKDERIMTLSKHPDALAFEHRASNPEPRAVFVSEHVLYLWSEEGGITEVMISTLFMCSSYMNMIMIFVGVVVVLIVLGVVALIVFVLLGKRHDFDEGGTSTVDQKLDVNMDQKAFVKRNKG